jgi:phospholipid/cholesterol/gamma-HCH transport system permease protein
MALIREIGDYVVLMAETFKRPDKGKVFRRQLFIDFQALGVDSIGIIAFISLFTGGIIAMQMAYNINNPLVPLYLVGYTTKQMMILEISPTIMSLILAGKVGSSIASEIGTMRVTEQIDALKVMGINPANYLILPKITAAMLFFPLLTIFSISIGLAGGLLAVFITGSVTTTDFIDGLQAWFVASDIFYALTKSLVFAFIITSVSGFKGYNLTGGSVAVGRASTSAVVSSSILIIIFDLILTQMLLT